MSASRDVDNRDGESPAARLKEFLEALSEEVQEFTRRKPLEGLLLSFVTGLMIGELLRRGR